MRLHPFAAALALAMFTSPAGAKVSRGYGQGTSSCYAYVRSNAQRQLVTRESQGRPTAQNPTSSAHGCGQLLIAQRRRFHPPCGGPASSNSPAVQMCAMSAYIDARYGSDAAALAHSLTQNRMVLMNDNEYTCDGCRRTFRGDEGFTPEMVDPSAGSKISPDTITVCFACYQAMTGEDRWQAVLNAVGLTP